MTGAVTARASAMKDSLRVGVGLLLALFVFVSAAGTSLAQDIYQVNPGVPGQTPTPKRLEIAGFVGSLSFSQSLGSSANLYQTVTGRASEVTFGRFFGARASWAFTKNIVAEAEWSYGTNGYAFAVDDVEVGTVPLDEQFDAEQIFWNGSFIYQVPTRYGIVPYGAFGVGQLRTRPSSPIAGIESLSTTDVSFGGGVKYWLRNMPWLGLRFDVRRHLASDGLNFPGNDDSPSGTAVTLGAFFRFF